MARVTWLQHRGGLLGLLGLDAGLAVAMLIGERPAQSAFATFVADRCATDMLHVPCGTIANNFANDTDPLSALTVALLVLPVVVGVFLGAPLVARELESGTYRFAFTQAIGRSRYLLTSLAVFVPVVVAGAVVLGLLLSQWAHPFEVVGDESAWDGGLFATSWFLLAAWSLCALAVGVVLGVAVKRTVAAMAATTALLAALVLACVSVLTPRLLAIAPTASGAISPVGLGLGALGAPSPPGEGPAGSWLVRAWMTGPGGHLLSPSASQRLLLAVSDGKADPKRLLELHHVAYWLAFQPGSRLWIFQGVEGAALLLVAAVAVLASLYRIRHLAY